MRKRRYLPAIAGSVLVADLVTKAWVVSSLTLHQSEPVLGDFLRFTYTHNPGAAFGIHVGEHSRVIFLVLSLVALGVLGYLYYHTRAGDRLRLAAIALVVGGALGNVVDRIRYEEGVVDFLDVGIGTLRWPIFNVADMAVTVGAVGLLVSFYLEDRRARREAGDDG